MFQQNMKKFSNFFPYNKPKCYAFYCLRKGHTSKNYKMRKILCS